MVQEMRVYGPRGGYKYTVKLPGIGSVDGFSATSRHEKKKGFFSFSSFNTPLSHFRLNLETGKVRKYWQPKLPVDRVTPILNLAAGTLRQDRLVARLTMLLGGLALALASLGLYGLMSYSVRQRTAELGIRFALGAPRARVLWMVFRESLLLMLAGLAIGIPIVLAASRLIGAMLFGISGTDPLTIAAAIAVLVAVGALSSYLPARRASRVNPLIALREE
jgi:ABC-type antimicrobial peptide transport system permease subunit